MSVIGTKSIVDWLREYKLISDTYSIDRLTNDLNELFYSSQLFPDIIGKTSAPEEIESEVRDYLDRITLLVTDDTKIKSKAELSALTLSKHELETRYEAYRNVDEALKLPSIGFLRVDVKDLLMRVEYCKKRKIPYKNEDGILLKDISGVTESQAYLPRFWEIYFEEYYKDNKDPESSSVLGRLDDDRLSGIYGNMQWYCYNNYGRFLMMSKDFDKVVKTYLEAHPEDPEQPEFEHAQICFLKSKSENPFIKEEKEEDLFMMSQYDPKPVNDYDRRNGRI